MSIQNWKFKTTDSGTFFWQAIAENAEILGQSSQNFKSRNGAKYNADLLGRSGKFSPKLLWDFTQNKDKKWLWKANNTVNKENVAASHKPFESQLQAVQNAMLFGYNGKLTALINNKNKSTSSNSDNSTKAGVAAGSVGSGGENKQNESTQQKNNRDSVYTRDSQEVGWLALLKWLILALLILAILWWFLPPFLKRFTNKNSDNKPTLSLTTNQSTGLAGSLQKSEFDQLKINLKNANLLDAVNQSTPITLLAPTNAAFQAIPSDKLDFLQKPENINQYQNLLKNHLFAGSIDLNALKDGTTIKSLAGIELPVKIEGEKLFIGGVEVDKTIDANANGFSVYSIPNLLNIPVQDAISTPTVVTPLPDASVIAQPIPTIIPAPVTTPNSNTISYKEGGNLDFLNKDGGFTTLLTAINASGLKDTLEGSGPITLYAPTDDAFKPLQSTVAELLKPENKTKLQTFLKGHVVLGKNIFHDFIVNTNVTNLNNQIITLNTNAAGGYGQVVGPNGYSLAPIEDIFTNNGVIQVLTDSPIL
jgi:uncharacterized surface protein with fasciclin (FAS1) repeats